MATACQSVRVVADLTMHVPRDAAGDLECGVESVVARIDAISDVESVDVTNLQPRLNDLQVDATVTVAVDVPRVADATDADVEVVGRDALADGFGVRSVERLRVEPAAADANEAMSEYG